MESLHSVAWICLGLGLLPKAILALCGQSESLSIACG